MPEINFGSPTVSGKIEVTTDNFKKGGTGQTIIMKGADTSCTQNVAVELYSVTADKTLYVTHLTISANAVTRYEVDDDTTNLIMGVTGSGNGIVLTFPTPLKFTDSVKYEQDVTATMSWGLVGWEEDT